MAQNGIMLRNMHLVGGGQRRVDLPLQHRAVFEEGCALVFQRWTALQLAVGNEWGGSSSRDKAAQLLSDVVQWFYTTKDHEILDLQDCLDEAIQGDFNVQAEDDSPYQVARDLVNMHSQVAAGDCSYVQQLRAAPGAAPLAACQRAENGMPEADEESSSSDDDEGSEDSGSDSEAMDAEGGEEMDMDDGAAQQGAPVGGQQQQQPKGPVVDEDGFQVVERRGKGRR